MSKDKKHVYRIGDIVRIVDPKFVERVGYPLVWPMLMDEFDAKLPVVREAMKNLIFTDASEEMFEFNQQITRTKTNATDRDFLKGVCMAAVRMRGFGGDERSLHYFDSLEFERFRGCLFEINGKRVVKTGKRFAGSSSVSYEGEYDYENGGLNDMKTHTLLKLRYLEIEACNVELVRAVEPMYYIRNTRAIIGNSILWWSDGGHGYTCDLRKAWKVPKSEARSICQDRPEQDVMVRAEVADKMAEKHVDAQKLTSKTKRTKGVQIEQAVKTGEQ